MNDVWLVKVSQRVKEDNSDTVVSFRFICIHVHIFRLKQTTTVGWKVNKTMPLWNKMQNENKSSRNIEITIPSHYNPLKQQRLSTTTRRTSSSTKKSEARRRTEVLGGRCVGRRRRSQPRWWFVFLCISVGNSTLQPVPEVPPHRLLDANATTPQAGIKTVHSINKQGVAFVAKQPVEWA